MTTTHARTESLKPHCNLRRTIESLEWLLEKGIVSSPQVFITYLEDMTDCDPPLARWQSEEWQKLIDAYKAAAAYISRH